MMRKNFCAYVCAQNGSDWNRYLMVHFSRKSLALILFIIPPYNIDYYTGGGWGGGRKRNYKQDKQH